MAEGLIRARLAAESRRDVEVASAGTWARPGIPATDHARATMAERGIDIGAHRSRELSREILERADLVLVMTRSHREGILAEFPDVASRLHLISSLEGGDWDLVDPVGQPMEAYRATARELDGLIGAGWESLIGSA